MKYDISITSFSERVANVPYEDGKWQGAVAFDRLQSLLVSVNSLLCSDLRLCKNIYISDDGSTDERLISFLKILHKSHSDKIRVIFNPYRGPDTHGTSINAYRAVTAGTEEYMVRLADDTLFHADWLNQLDALQRKVENDLQKDWGALSVCNFRTIGAYQNEFEDSGDGTLAFKRIPSFAALYKRSLWDERFPSMQHLRNDLNGWASGAYHYEFGYQDLCINKGLKSYTTQKSYVQSYEYKGKPTLNMGGNVADPVKIEHEC